MTNRDVKHVDPSPTGEGPPSANRGDETYEALGLVSLGASVDALTVTLRREPASWALDVLQRWLRSHGLTDRPEPGKAGRGFGASESYKLCEFLDSAVLWRRCTPVVASEALGPGYEGWEVNGPAARILVELLLEHPKRIGRASRMDVAFDFGCPEDYWPADVERAVTEHAERRGFTISYQGERDTRTVYVGSRKSGRMVRIYRHDACHGGGAPVMRIEFEAKQAFAAALWDCWKPDGGFGLEMAAWHVAELTGRCPWSGMRAPEPDAAREKYLVRAVAAAAKSYGAVLRAFAAAGGDIPRLLEEARRPKDREQRRRELLYQRSVEGWSTEKLATEVLRELQGRPTGPRQLRKKFRRVESPPAPG